jgi:hypothetical protein
MELLSELPDQSQQTRARSRAGSSWFTLASHADGPTSKLFAVSLKFFKAIRELKRQTISSALVKRPSRTAVDILRQPGFNQPLKLAKAIYALRTKLPAVLHWAVRIDGRYFELSRVPGTDGYIFKGPTTWTATRANSITHISSVGHTYFTDSEIFNIGDHYVQCWGLTYNAAFNNCQSVINSLLADILVSGYDVHKHSAGYNLVNTVFILNGDLRSTFETVLRRQGYSVEKIAEMRDEALAWFLLLIDQNIYNDERHY